MAAAVDTRLLLEIHPLPTFQQSNPLGKKKKQTQLWRVKESACNAGNLGSIPGSGRSPGEGNGNPLQYSLPGESHGQRCLGGLSPWGRRQT